MSQHAAIMFQFQDDRSAAIAYDLLQELGYDPVGHGENRVHIHVDGNDLASALEIAQANGGKLMEQSELQEERLTNTAYELDSIHIPAHVVNEDWIAAQEETELGLANRDEDGYDPDLFDPDAKSYSYFSGDVRI